MEKMGLGKGEQGFFFIFGQKMKKNLVQLAFKNPFFGRVWVPDPSLANTPSYITG